MDVMRVTINGEAVPVLHGDGLLCDAGALRALFSGGLVYCRRSEMFLRAAGLAQLPIGVYRLWENDRWQKLN